MSDDLKRLALAFINEISGIPDISMRCTKINQRMKNLTSESIAHVLHEILKENSQGKPKAQSVYLSLIKNRDLIGVIGNEKFREVKDSAIENGFELVLGFLTSRTAKRRKVPGDDISPLALKLKHLTLGEKKSLARRKDFRNIEFLLFDTNPSVISNLLLNPRITEMDVIKIAANKMTRREVIEEVFRNNKWISRYRIKKALVFNENTPIDISLNLCNSLLKKDLKLIANDGKLDPQIIEKARSVLKAKK